MSLIEILAQLEPISTLSPGRLKELAGLCFTEKVSKDIDPLRMNVTGCAQALYLVNGELGLRFKDGSKKILRAGSHAAKFPVDPQKLGLQDTIALTEIEIVRIDVDLLDIMMTWDQLSDSDRDAPPSAAPTNKTPHASWMRDTSVFSAEKLQTGVFSKLPAANVEEMFSRLEPIEVKAGQVIIRQGAEGDYYYLIEQGEATVTRLVDNADIKLLAELKAGDAFGEEALVSDNKRNAAVTMKTDGILLRLSKADFVALLKAPLVTQITMEEAQKLVNQGAMWLDVRLPTEYKFDHPPKAINVPLNQLRWLIPQLDKDRTYIAYCTTGRRSSAAAFILAQSGFNVKSILKQ